VRRDPASFYHWHLRSGRGRRKHDADPEVHAAHPALPAGKLLAGAEVFTLSAFVERV